MRHRHADSRPSPQAGFAIGALLFVVALLALLGIVIAAGGGGFSNAGMADRITPNITQQANLIRSVVNQCNIQFLAARALCNTTGTCPSCTLITGASCSVTVTNTDPYPQSTGSGTAVGSLVCDPAGGQSLWTQTLMPQPTSGFTNWTYYDGQDSGGRCIWIEPSPVGPNYSGNTGIVQGLTRAANNFSNGTSFSSANEVVYDPASTSQKFLMWITVPTGTPDTHCYP